MLLSREGEHFNGFTIRHQLLSELPRFSLVPTYLQQQCDNATLIIFISTTTTTTTGAPNAITQEPFVSVPDNFTETRKTSFFSVYIHDNVDSKRKLVSSLHEGQAIRLISALNRF